MESFIAGSSARQGSLPVLVRRSRFQSAGLLAALLVACFAAVTRPAHAVPYSEYSGRDASGFYRMVLDLYNANGKVVLYGGRMEFKDLGNPYPIQPASGNKVPKNLNSQQFAGDVVFAQANAGGTATLFIGTLNGRLGVGPIHVSNVRFAYRYRTEDLSMDLLPVGAPPPGGGGGGAGGGGGGAPPPRPTPGVYLFDNTNTGIVMGGPRSPTVVTFNHAVDITEISTYHWNNGRGAAPGRISLVSRPLGRALSRTFGPWNATGSAGQNNMPDVNWVVKPGITVPAGTYEVVDSDSRTWSCNMNSRFIGFTRISGH